LKDIPLEPEAFFRAFLETYFQYDSNVEYLCGGGLLLAEQTLFSSLDSGIKLNISNISYELYNFEDGIF
jgi:hypothetical protein